LGATEQGITAEITGKIFPQSEDEMNFTSFFLGDLGTTAIMGIKAPFISKMFDAFGAEGLKKIQQRIIAPLNARGISEFGEEAIQELTKIYSETKEGQSFLEELEKKYGSLSDITKLFAQSYVQGAIYKAASVASSANAEYKADAEQRVKDEAKAKEDDLKSKEEEAKGEIIENALGEPQDVTTEQQRVDPDNVTRPIKPKREGREYITDPEMELTPEAQAQADFTEKSNKALETFKDEIQRQYDAMNEEEKAQANEIIQDFENEKDQALEKAVEEVSKPLTESGKMEMEAESINSEIESINSEMKSVRNELSKTRKEDLELTDKIEKELKKKQEERDRVFKQYESVSRSRDTEQATILLKQLDKIDKEIEDIESQHPVQFPDHMTMEPTIRKNPRINELEKKYQELEKKRDKKRKEYYNKKDAARQKSNEEFEKWKEEQKKTEAVEEVVDKVDEDTKAFVDKKALDELKAIERQRPVTEDDIKSIQGKYSVDGKGVDRLKQRFIPKYTEESRKTFEEEVAEAEEQAVKEEAQGTFVGNIGKKVELEGRPGTLVVDGQTVLFQADEGADVELGNVEKLSQDFIARYGLTKLEGLTEEQQADAAAEYETKAAPIKDQIKVKEAELAKQESISSSEKSSYKQKIEARKKINKLNEEINQLNEQAEAIPETFKPEGELVDGVMMINGREYEFIEEAKPKDGQRIAKVKDVETGQIKRLKGYEAEKMLNAVDAIDKSADRKVQKERQEGYKELEAKEEAKKPISKEEQQAKREARRKRRAEAKEKKRIADELRAQELEIEAIEAEGVEALAEMEKKNAENESNFENALRDRMEAELAAEEDVVVEEESPMTRKVKVYHGTNKEFDSFKEDDKGVIWLTDNYEYARQQGSNVKEVEISPENTLTSDKLAKISDDQLYEAVNEVSEEEISRADFDNHWLPEIKQRIKDGDSTEMVFDGMGEGRVAKALGFDVEKVKNPYDKTGESFFYKVFDSALVNPKQDLRAQKEAEIQEKVEEYRKENRDKIEKFLEDLIEFTKLKRGSLQSNLLGVPQFMINQSLKVALKAYKGGKTLAQAVDAAYQYLRDEGQTVSKVKLTKYIAEDMKKSQAEVKKKKPVEKKEQKEEVKSKSEGKLAELEAQKAAVPKGQKATGTTKQAIQDQIKAYKEGVRELKKDIKNLDNKIKAFLSSAEMRGKFTPKQTEMLIKGARDVKHERNLEKYLAYAEKVISKANFAEDISKIDSLISKTKKLINNKQIPLNLKNLGKRIIEEVDPKKINDPSDYIKILEQYNEATSGFGAVDNIPTDIDKLKSQMNKFDELVFDKEAEALYNDSDLKEHMTLDQFKDMLEYQKSSEELNSLEKLESIGETISKVRSRLERVVKWRLPELKTYSENNTEIDSRSMRTINSFLKIFNEMDVKDFTTPQLRQINNIINEITMFDSFNRTGDLQSLINGSLIGKNLLKKYKGKVNFSAFASSKITKSLLSLDNFFKSIASGEFGKKMIADLTKDLSKGNQIATKKSDVFNIAIETLAKKLKKPKESAVRLEMYSFLSQHELDMTTEEISNDLLAKKAQIELEIKKLKKESENKKRSGATRRGFEKMHEMYSKIYNESFKDVKSKDELESKLSKEESAIIDFSRKSFESTKNPLKDSYNRFTGKEFIEMENYLPLSAKPFAKYGETDLSGFKYDPPSNNSIDKDQSGTTKKRVKLQTKNSDGSVKSKQELDQMDVNTLYLFNFMDNMKQKYRETLYDIHTLEQRKDLDYALNSKYLRDLFGSELHKEVVRKMADQVNTQRGSFNDQIKEYSKWVRYPLNAMRYVKATKLKTIDQWVKQPISIIAHTSAVYGKSANKAIALSAKIMTDPKYREAFDKLISTSDVSNRTTEGEYIIKQQESLVVEALKKMGVEDKALPKAYIKAVDGALVTADDLATKLSWLAAYIHESGGPKDFDLIEAANKVDQDAIARADSGSADINNVSDFSKSPEMWRNSDKALVRELLFNYKSFSVNMAIRNAIAWRDLLAKPKSELTEGDRKMAARYILGSMAASIIFQATKATLVYTFWDEITDLILGVDTDDEDEVEERLKKSLAKGAFDYAFGGLPEPAEEGMKKFINWGVKEGKRIMTGEKPKKYDDLFYTSDKGLPGAYGMPIELIQQMYEGVTSDEFKDVEQYKLMAAFSGILGEGNLDRFFNKAISKAKKQEKKKNNEQKKKASKKSKEGRGSGGR
jgi:hypothetical protein